MREPYVTGGFLYHAGTGRVLLHRRDAHAPRYPNAWASLGGRSEAEGGGDPVATWRRELREELGIALPREQVLALADYLDPRNGLPRYVFYCEWPTLDTDFALAEGAGLAWFPLDDALHLPDLTDVDAEDLMRLRDRLSTSTVR